MHLGSPWIVTGTNSMTNCDLVGGGEQHGADGPNGDVQFFG